MSTPYRKSDGTFETPPKPRKPWFWWLRVWLYSGRVRRYADANLRIQAEDVNGAERTVTASWEVADSIASILESTPPGSSALVGCVLFRPECVPTMARYARDAADAYNRSSK